MQNREDILEAARSLRPLLKQFIGEAAEEFDQKLAALLAASPNKKVDNQILELVAQHDCTREWMKEFLEIKRSSNSVQRDEMMWIFISRYFAPLPGDPAPIPASRFECPQGDYVWYQPSAGAMPPECPTHQQALVRKN